MPMRQSMRTGCTLLQFKPSYVSQLHSKERANVTPTQQYAATAAYACNYSAAGTAAAVHRRRVCLQIPAARTAAVHRNLSRAAVRVDLGTAPIMVSTRDPALKIMTVGMERTPYWLAMSGLASVLILTALALPA